MLSGESCALRETRKVISLLTFYNLTYENFIYAGLKCQDDVGCLFICDRIIVFVCFLFFILLYFLGQPIVNIYIQRNVNNDFSNITITTEGAYCYCYVLS